MSVSCQAQGRKIVQLVTGKAMWSEKKRERKDYVFRHQFDEKPSIIPGCPELNVVTVCTMTECCDVMGDRRAHHKAPGEATSAKSY